MSHYDDLTSCDYFGRPDVALTAVGWLDTAHAYQRGQVPREQFERVATLLVDPWQPFVFAGRHECPFCVFTGGPIQMMVRRDAISLGVTNLFVPTDKQVFVAPSLVLHYMDAHEYAPPNEFLQAVAACPPMRSMEYLRAVSKHGVARLCTPPRATSP